MAGGNPAPTAIQLPGQTQAAGNAFGDIGSLNNPYSAIQPYEYLQMLAAFNNPNIAGYMTGANTAGGAATTAGDMSMYGGNLLMGDAANLYSQGADPQNALYNQLLQQNRDQSSVTNSMYGLSGSGAGAGIAGDQLNKFNIDWQNNQLQRMLAASRGAGADITGANTLYGGAAQDYLSGGQIPYAAYNDVLGGGNNALNAYMTGAGQGNSLTQNAIGDWLQYLGTGQSGVGLNQNAYGMDQNTAANAGSFLMPFTTAAAGSLFGGGSTGGDNPFITAARQQNPNQFFSNDPFANTGSFFGSGWGAGTSWGGQ